MKSNANSKLDNISTIRKILDGDHKSQTRTVTSLDDDVVTSREVGETWVDDNGTTWEQKKGFKVRTGKLTKLRQEISKPSNCFPDCTFIKPSRADLKMIAVHDMCLDCVARKETQMRMDGTYEEYAKDFIRNNAKAWLNDARKEAGLAAEFIAGGKFALEDGTTENWKGGDAEMIKSKFMEDFDKFEKEFMTKLNGE